MEIFGKKLTILLVEDNEINQLVTSKILNQLGVTVRWAHHGREAVEMIASREFHLVLMDLQMPVMDGFESTHIIRSMSDQYFRTIPIIAFTASGMIEVGDKARQYGMNDFVGKPVTLQSLENLIIKYLAPSQMRPLCVDFDLHTDGDEDFKTELIDLLIENISELQKSISLYNQGKLPTLKAILHKVKPALTILNDNDLFNSLESVTSHIENSCGQMLQKNMDNISELCESIKHSLSIELSNSH